MIQDCLFFGTFNPIHQGHLTMARHALAQGGFKRILFVPAASPPHRQGDFDMASFEDRCAMVRLACKGHPDFAVSPVEASLPKPSYTCDTLQFLYPQASRHQPMAMLMGSDALAGLATWKEPLWLAQHVVFWQAPRTGTPPVTDVVVDKVRTPLHTVLLDMAPVDVSATQIREALGQEQPSCALISPEVWAYCHQHQLYQTRNILS